MKKILYVLIVLAAASPARAAKVEADPSKEYVLTPDVGPYVVCVKGYTGTNARALSNQLVLHLRRHNFPAYVFDYSGEERRKTREMLQERYKMAPELVKKKHIRVEEQWGVVAGSYKDLESAGKDVDKIKKLPWDNFAKTSLDHVPDLATKMLYSVSPFANSFATRSPLLAAAKPGAAGPDPLWKDLNDGRPYNLLKCPKGWTLAVKQFQGVNPVQARSSSSKFLDALGLGSKVGETLDASAKQAEEVARLLRAEYKLEAYVLHTRGASIVTVGGFESRDDPRLKQVQLQLGDQLRKIKLGSDPATTQLFQWFAQPMPMEVPKL